MRGREAIVIGLTGQIATGKSTAASILEKMGARVFNADEEVHRIFRRNKNVIIRVAKAFPKAFINGKINRKILSEEAFKNKRKLRTLERIVHPIIKARVKKFISENKKKSLIAIEVPLLFKIGADKFCDYIVLFTAPKYLKKTRALSRKGMTKEKFLKILNNQYLCEKKAQRADFKVSTNCGLPIMEKKLKKIVERITKKRHSIT